MSEHKYGFREVKENMARAVIRDSPVSTKHCIEISKHLKNKTTERAKTILQESIAQKKAIPFTRFTNGAGHKTGIGPGKFVIKACTHILGLVEGVEHNALNKGLSSDLEIIHIASQQGASQYHYGRQTRRKNKRTHVEIIVKEKSIKKPQKKQETTKSTKPAETPVKEVKKDPVQPEKKQPEQKQPEKKETDSSLAGEVKPKKEIESEPFPEKAKSTDPEKKETEPKLEKEQVKKEETPQRGAQND
ncbi:50S ribosomal protein L22 [Candidatus Woesearchaeota archaeon]|nr:50S ribosomal protein L22 [Candidatus Woesearchaeota archaeon]